MITDKMTTTSKPVNTQNFVLSFYGDDFTGSTDVMETLALNGLPAALFLKTPTLDEVRDFTLKKKIGGDRLRAFGVAGIARSLAPGEMRKELESVFAGLSKISADFFQYKICSTLDSSPSVGNIGVATEVALQYFPSRVIPLVVGAPFLNRFVAFSNLFARLDGETYRIDRHPVMSRHPVTPMEEGDIRVHLSQQTDRKFIVYDLLQLRADADPWPEVADADQVPYLLCDTLTNEDLVKIASWLCRKRPASLQFMVASSGISYGIARYLRQKEGRPEVRIPEISPVRQILVAAGSCSPVTARQIDTAIRSGMKGIRIDVLALTENKSQEIERVYRQTVECLDNGLSPILFTALGPGDPSIKALELKFSGDRNILLGESIGEIVARVLNRHGKLRTVIVGGDTSGYVSRYLKIYALETMAPVAPGAPLCVAHAQDPRFDGLEIALKGGQNGKDDYFEKIRG